MPTTQSSVPPNGERNGGIPAFISASTSFSKLKDAAALVQTEKYAYHTEQSVTNGERKEGVTVCINASTHPASWMDCFGSGIDADYEVCVARRLG